MKITIRNFQKKIPIYPKRIKRAILKVLSCEGTRLSGEITVCFVSSKKIKELNFKYHKKNTPTDVLAFDLSDKTKPKRLFADIVISADVAKTNAKIYKTSNDKELKLYAIHGILHLLGYNDRTNRQRLVMRKKEQALLK